MKRVFSFIHSKVARRIFVLFVICALLPVCILALVSLQRVSARLEMDSQERLRRAAKSAGMAIFGGLNLLQAELEFMSISPVEKSREIPRQMVRPAGVKSFRAVTLVKSADNIKAIPGMPRILSPAARAHLDAGNALIYADADLGAGSPIFMATSMNRSLPQNGLLVGEINPEYLWTLVGYTLPPGVDICILGPSGKQLYSTSPKTPPLASLVNTNQKRASTGQSGWQPEDEKYLVNSWSLFMKPAFLADSWTVASFQSKRDALGPARSFITTFLLVVFLTLFVVIFFSSLLIRRSLVPLSILKDGARRLSSGDFHSRVEIDSGDEFEELADSFNDMTAQLGNQFNSLSEMGMLVQRILAAHDRDTIIDAVMSRFRKSVSCEWLGISFTDENSNFRFLTACNKGSGSAHSETLRFGSLLNEIDFESLQSAGKSLYVSAEQGFTPLLSPMVSEGAREFFLLPIIIKERFLGILTIGYRSVPERIREELVRSRQIADEIAIALDNIRLIEELNRLSRGTIEVLANTVDAKSPWTAGHSKRVTRLALAIGKEMGLSTSDLELIQLAGLLHDMGKIGVPEYILDKPGRLTEEEYALIKKHPEKGADILRPIRAYHGAIPIVAQHHEQYDGQGYPLGLACDEIVLGARILAVADVFDALNSDRPYRQGWEIGKVFSYLEEKAGSSFDPKVVKAFLKIDRAVYLESDANAEPRMYSAADSRQEGHERAVSET